MKHYDIIIAGSGLGGLQCGYILAKKGYNVCILEKNHQTGGCLQSFRRGRNEFDTGFHFVGGLDEGQFLHRLFQFYDLLDLPWQRLDDDGFAKVILDGDSYLLPTGYDNFVDGLSARFPHQRRQLENYTALLRDVGNSIENALKPDDRKAGETLNGLFQQSAHVFLQQTITDPVLRNVLSGASLTMELSPGLPLYTFAQINNSFIQSSWRLNGGGSLIADRLADNIRRVGGTVLTRAEVTRFIENNGRITAVEVNGEEQFSADYFISNLHPALTLSLIPDSKAIRRIYKKRITQLPNTFGMFTTHLQLREDSIPYLNRNVFRYDNPDRLWDNQYISGAPVESALISYRTPTDGTCFTRNIDILTSMHWEDVERWTDTYIEKRGEDYKDFKQQKANECIKFAEKSIPGLSQAIESVYTSTPLTYRDYTGTWQGSAYGIRKNYNDILMTLLTPHTPIQNLFLTGQNLNLHGIMGVSITSLLTCSGLVGSRFKP